MASSSSARTLGLACKCGAVRGAVDDVGPARVNRVVCYCDDCRAYAHFLDRSDLLDAYGGTDIVQVRSSSVRFETGHDQLRCMRLSERGMIRWYTACCRTPVGNTVAAFVPFAGMVRACLDPGIDGSGSTADAVLGPAEGCQARFAVNGRPEGAHPSASAALVARIAARLLSWKLASFGRSSPYFDRSGKPTVAPKVLDAQERSALRARDAEPNAAR